MTRRDRDRIETLERRREFLAQRIKNYKKDGNSSRDRAELHALNWAIRVVTTADADGYLQQLYADGRG